MDDFQFLTAAKLTVLTELLAHLYADRYEKRPEPIKELGAWAEFQQKRLEAAASATGMPQELAARVGMQMEGELAAFVERVGGLLREV
jgi:hypothetical protein